MDRKATKTAMATTMGIGAALAILTVWGLTEVTHVVENVSSEVSIAMGAVYSYVMNLIGLPKA